MKMTTTMAALVTILLSASLSYAVNRPLIGDTLPVFSLVDTEGKTHSLTDYRGSPVLLLTVGYG
jgi:hypothetical protein